ncbi:MAG: hypothetical protein AAGA92_09615 [Planctomycetota bacterium]
MDAGRHLDLSSDPQPAPEGPAAGARPFLGVRFACCDVYARVYLNRDGTAYQGRCPRCVRTIEFQVGEGGTSSRFFTAQ